MIAEFIDSLTSFVATHPHWIGIAIFTATALESMAFVGSFFPGMTVVLALSGIAASIGANVWLLVVWCTLGAVAGDGISFWLGHRYGSHLKAMWPFRARPELLDRGAEFFERNGGKSVVIGRFLPFTRAVVPVAAGMMGMNPVRFYIANILSAIGWALASILPAAGVGLALSVLNQASSRLAAILGAVLALFLLALLFGRLFVRVGLPRLEWGFAKVSEKISHASGPGASLLGWLAPADKPALAGVLWVFLTSGLALSFAMILEDLVTNDPLVRMDVAVSALFQGLRTPIGDRAMSAVTAMGDGTVVLSASLVLVAGLLLARAWRTSALAAVVLLAGSAVVPLFKWSLHKPRPIELYSGAEAFSFPSGHATFTALVWGMIVIIGARGLPRQTQATLWAVAFTLSSLVGLSRVYLSAHWPSDVIGGLLLGWTLASVFGLIEKQIGEEIRYPRALALGTLAALTAAWGVHAADSFDKNLALYQPRENIVRLSVSDWRSLGWRQFPSARIDLDGEFEEPLPIQVAAAPADIDKAAETTGWGVGLPFGWAQTLQFFGTKKSLTALAPLPLLHNGAPATHTFIKAAGNDDRRYVLRLWSTPDEIGDLPGNPRVLLGSLTEEWVTQPFVGINLLHSEPLSKEATEKLIASMVTKSLICRLPLSPGETSAASPILLAAAPQLCRIDG